MNYHDKKALIEISRVLQNIHPHYIIEIISFTHFYSYSNEVPVFFRYKKEKGVKWTDVRKALFKKLKELEIIKVNSDCLIEGIPFIEDFSVFYSNNNILKFEYKKENKEFIVFENTYLD